MHLVRRPVGGVEPRGARLEQDEDEGGRLKGGGGEGREGRLKAGAVSCGVEQLVSSDKRAVEDAGARSREKHERAKGDRIGHGVMTLLKRHRRRRQRQLLP